MTIDRTVEDYFHLACNTGNISDRAHYLELAVLSGGDKSRAGDIYVRTLSQIDPYDYLMVELYALEAMGGRAGTVIKEIKKKRQAVQDRDIQEFYGLLIDYVRLNSSLWSRIFG